VLAQVRRLGFAPATVFDVGVDAGTPELYEAFPEARIVLVEPNQDCRPQLERLCARLPRAELVMAAATREPGEVTLYVHPDPAGSSLYREAEGPEADGEARAVPGLPLDAIAAELGCWGPALIKADTQGSELDVLEGAAELLDETEVVVLEVSLFQFFVGGPDHWDVVRWMHSRGFVVYEVFGSHYRPLDGALAQLDMAFVRHDGRFRRTHRFASPEQRAAGTRLWQAGPLERRLLRLRHFLSQLLRSRALREVSGGTSLPEAPAQDQ
jgi:FkbM family methyltransferase